ncbi:MAG TPA: hypothetical protein VFC85_06255 [Verrucomicrobiae bacterium]|nr:hypothetical protein [Verrucomicrobiae bacterium]
MNNQTPSKIFARPARILLALFAGLFFTPPIHAQIGTNVDNRFLFIFDTSSDMKKRVPAEQKALKELLALSVGGQLHSGDSMGVWTFDRKLHAGEFPLQHWDASDAVMIASNITRFIDKHKYSKKTSFAALQPVLNQVAANSERLTVFIFSDGETPMVGTPYDAGINSLFKEKQSQLKKDRQPFVITLRAQLGKYVGCTLSFPPAPINFPQFPPLPSPPPPPQTNEPAPANPPVLMAPPLVIIGTNVGTNIPPPEPSEAAPTHTEMITPTNVSEVPTNFPAPTNAPYQTNANGLPPPNSTAGGKGVLAAGAIILAAAIIAGIFLAMRLRRKDTASLISRSMHDRK